MARRKASDAFDVKLTADERQQLASDWSTDLDDALMGRDQVIADGGLIDLLDWFYEQGRSNPGDRPFPGAADLTSYFITENVDALRAWLMKAVFGVKPFCFVEGWGQAAAKAPFVEAFHEWQIKREGLKAELARTIHGALIEDCYILEVSEKVETRRTTEVLDAALELDEATGGAIFVDGKPTIRRDEAGDPVPAQEGEPSAKVEYTSTKTKRLGPRYDAISMKDFVFLPGHARSRRQLWGYAKRFHLRVPELQEKVADRLYDAAAVEALGEQSDREAVHAPSISDISPQRGPAAEKELWELSIKRDLDGDGREEWYIATLSVKHRALLRLKRDTFVMKIGRPRCVPFVLFPRRNAVYGYSYAGDKLLTLAEEHTALRNMRADRSALATAAPMTVLQGAALDLDTQPFGPGRAVIVRAHDEIRQLEVADVPTSIVEQLRDLVQAKERVGLLADSSVGVLSDDRRTLGENKLVAGGSGVRVSEVIGHLHAAIADVMALRHAIWVETLEADPRGVEAPADVLAALSARGHELQNGRFTAAQIKGDFQFEPYGSAETADPEKQRADFNNWLIALANFAKVCPALAVIFQNMEVAKAILEEGLRVYNVRNQQPFLGAFQAAQALPPAGGPMGAPPMGPAAGRPQLPPALAELIASLTGGGAAPPLLPDEAGADVMEAGY